MFTVVPGVETNIFFLVFLGLAVGILSGFAGVGGGFFMTPALIMLGFPGNLAVGTSLTWVTGNSIIGALRHHRLGNIDVKLGLVMTMAAMAGIELGVRIVNWAKDSGLADEVILSISSCVLVIVGLYTLLDSIATKRRLDTMFTNSEKMPADTKTISFPHKLQSINIPPMVHFIKSGITISIWIVLAVGFFVGTLTGILGVGGAFVMMPALVYLVGIPTFTAVGTSLFQVIFSAAYGSIRHAMSSNVIFLATLIMLVSSSIGVLFGAQITRYVKGISIRYILAISILFSAVAISLKLLDLFIQSPGNWLHILYIVIMFGGIWVVVALTIGLFIMAIRHRKGQHIPTWVKSLIAT